MELPRKNQGTSYETTSTITHLSLSTPPCVFFTFFKSYKWCQIAQSLSNDDIKRAPIHRSFTRLSSNM